MFYSLQKSDVLPALLWMVVCEGKEISRASLNLFMKVLRMYMYMHIDLPVCACAKCGMDSSSGVSLIRGNGKTDFC